MKRILLACFLLTATCSVSFVQTASAQTAPPTVTLADFTAKINLMDTYIGAGDMTNANATWLLVHNMMLNILAKSKYSIHNPTSPADKTAHEAIFTNQYNIYTQVWGMKTDLATNRAALHTKLTDFGATIY